MSHRPESESRSPHRLAIVGTDLKFIRPLLPYFSSAGYEVRVDEWPKFRAHDESRTNQLLSWADTVVCEWAGPNAVLASRGKHSEQRLIVRLHRMELGHPYWQDIDIAAVDCVVTVGPHYRRRTIETTNWPDDKVIVVPNFVDARRLDHPKQAGAISNIGMIGVASSRKRLDIALDALAEVRERDERARLFLKGQDPWNSRWVSDRPGETEYFDEIRSRIATDARLGNAVVLDPPGDDVGDWLTKIGVILSTSDDESFHLSPAEGMASGAVPVIMNWPGAEEVYDPNWLVGDSAEISDRILGLLSDPTRWRTEGRRARAEVLNAFELSRVADIWVKEVLPQPDGRPRPLSVGIVSGRNAYTDPSLRALAYSLDSVGHQATVVSPGKPDMSWPDTIGTHPPQPRLAQKLGLRLRASFGSSDPGTEAIRRTVETGGFDVIYPHREKDLAYVPDEVPTMRSPTWKAPPCDMTEVAPHSLRLGSSVGVNAPLQIHASAWPPYRPAPGRLAGKSGVVAYRHTPTSPGRYLESAMRHSGMHVVSLDGHLDWSAVPEDALFVVVVESPYPALEVRGVRHPTPTFFWVHHGEHHLAGNIRLTYRYEADAVLMAHSWHLAHRFPVPTYRFPFAVPTEFEPSKISWEERKYDVAMVGAGIGGSGGRYDKRRDLVARLTDATDIETMFSYGLPPEQMLRIYGNARIVINEGGIRHFPITMRVFEALGSGALLITEDTPGTDTVLRPQVHYVPMGNDIADQVRQLLGSDRGPAMASAGERWARSRHGYEHRVDQLVRLAADTSLSSTEHPFPPQSDLARIIDDDPDVQHIALFGEVEPLGLHDRAVRRGDIEKLAERSIDAVVIGRGAPPDLKAAVQAARGYVYVHRSHHDAVSRLLTELEGEVSITAHAEWTRVDVGGSLYRMRTADHPLSS